MSVHSMISLARMLPRLGWRRLVMNAIHKVRHRSGWYAWRTPAAASWPEVDVPSYSSAVSPFRPAPARELLRKTVTDAADLLAAADRLCEGEMLYFSTSWLRRAPWNADPRNGLRVAEDHWSRITVPRAADIKWIWEASRFDWVYTLGRAWGLTGEERYAEAFWQLFVDWRDHNPPNRGVNWNCGQECGLRLVALAWAAGVFRDSQSATPLRLASLWQTVELLAVRVEASIIYALSQHNNHGLAEATALFVAGKSMPSHRRSARWVRRGRRLVERQIGEQFADDGSYVLHSFNYLREGIRDCLLFFLAQRNTGETPAGPCLSRVSAAARLIEAVQDQASGQVPNYGANDGANIASLSGCSYDDFRPVVQLARAVTDRVLAYPCGPWDEELLWHLGEEGAALPAAAREAGPAAAEEGGYYIFSSARTRAFLRCHTYSHRPTHADLLHFDLWIGGQNLLLDSGSYSYHDEKRWGEYLERTEAHNTATVDGRDQMRKVSRFLWADWPRSRVLRCDSFAAGEATGWRVSGEHDAYSSLGVTHRRTVLQVGDDFAVIDDFLRTAGARRKLCVHWHSPEDPRADLGLQTHAARAWSCQVLSGSAAYPVTARSLRYGQLLPKIVRRFSIESAAEERLITTIGAHHGRVLDGGLEWHGVELSLSCSNDVVAMPSAAGSWRKLV